MKSSGIMDVWIMMYYDRSISFYIHTHVAGYYVRDYTIDMHFNCSQICCGGSDFSRIVHYIYALTEFGLVSLGFLRSDIAYCSFISCFLFLGMSWHMMNSIVSMPA